MKRDTSNQDGKKNALQSFLGGLGRAFNKYIGNPFETVDKSNDLCYHDNTVNGITINIIQPKRSVTNPMTSNTKVKTEPKIQVQKQYDHRERAGSLLPASSVVGMNNALKKQCLCVCNVLRDKPAVANWIIDNFGDKCLEITNIWVKMIDKMVGIDLDNRPIYEHDIDILAEKPIISNEYNHMLVLYSDDVNYLNYVKFELDKYLGEIDMLNKTFVKSNTEAETVQLFNNVIKGLGDDFKNDNTLREVVKETAQKFGMSEEEIYKIMDKYTEK